MFSVYRYPRFIQFASTRELYTVYQNPARGTALSTHHRASFPLSEPGDVDLSRSVDAVEFHPF